MIHLVTSDKYCGQDNKMHLDVTPSDLKMTPDNGHPKSEIIYSDFDPLDDSNFSIRFDEFGDDFISNHENKIVVGHYVIRRREVWFVCSAVIFFGVCIGLSVTLGLLAQNSASGPANTAAPDSNRGQYIKLQQCEAQQCFQLSSLMASSMNRHMDPCVDFGEFACGGFASSHPLLKGESYNSMLDITAQQMDEQLRLLIENSDLESRYSADKNSVSFLFKAKKVYQSCVQDTYGTRLGAGSLLEIIHSIGGWSVLNNWDENAWDIASTIETISGKLLVEIFFSISVVSDKLDARQNRILISPPNFNEARTLMVNFRESDALVEYKKFISATTLLLMENEQQRRQLIIPDKQQSIKTLITDVIYMENRIYEILDKTEITFQAISIRHLQETFPWMNWQSYLTEIIPGIDVTNETLIYMECFEYLRKVSIILQLVPNRSLHNFLMWRLVRDFLPYLSMDYQQILAVYNRAVPINGFHSIGERCIHFLKLGIMREAVLSFLYHDAVVRDHLQQIKEVIQNIQTSIFKSDLWFQDVELTNLIKKKLSGLQVVVESEVLSNSSSLNEFYEKLQVTDNYFTNLINIRHFAKWKLSDSYHQSRAPFTISQQNEFIIIGNYNLILIPIHFIHPPFFDGNYPQHVIYSRLGTLVAYAMLSTIAVEGVDNYFSGRDVRYTFRETPSSLVLNFFKDCNLDEALNGSSNGYFYKFPKLLDPNAFIKILAAKAAHEAYRNYSRKTRQDTFIPGLGKLSLEQVFFLSLSQMMCENADPIFLQTASSYGIAVGNQAINRIVSQLSFFATSYQCQNSGHQPSFKITTLQKCDIQ